MSYKDYLNKNDKYLEASTTKIDTKLVELLTFGIISFAIGFAGGLMPAYDGLILGLIYLFLIFLFIYIPIKKK